ncbi:uncharacterized protein LOC135114506 [Scylla paramamosain]|uniref:uncharacterized protein LOC135114506 n=1 Tax=Scylla paramamosain TaxID=85552 RepID=UPI0030827DD5
MCQASLSHGGRPADLAAACRQHREIRYLQLYMLRRLRSLGTPTDELRGVYLTFILPKLMYASPAWSSSLTHTQQLQLESVQKRACRVILGPAYTTYEEALTTLSLSRLSTRHREALEKFGRGLLHHPRLRHMLPPDAPRIVKFFPTPYVHFQFVNCLNNKPFIIIIIIIIITHTHTHTRGREDLLTLTSHTLKSCR